MARDWYLRHEDNVEGPFTRTELKHKIENKELLVTMDVSVDQENWFSIRQLPYLLSQFMSGKKKNKRSPRRWKIRLKGKDQGPFTMAEIRHFHRNGKIKTDMEISEDGENWLNAEEIPVIIKAWKRNKKDKLTDEVSADDIVEKDVFESENDTTETNITILNETKTDDKILEVEDNEVLPELGTEEETNLPDGLEDTGIIEEELTEEHPPEDKPLDPIDITELEVHEGSQDSGVILKNTKTGEMSEEDSSVEIDGTQSISSSTSEEFFADSSELIIDSNIVLEVSEDSNETDTDSEYLVPLGAMGDDSMDLDKELIEEIKEVPPLLETGKMMGKCQIDRFIEKGGMSEVYLAFHNSLDIQVAIKVLFPALAEQSPQFTQRFIKEARTAAKLHHTNIVQIFDFGIEDKFHYIVMEYIKGETLHDRIKRIGKMLWPSILKMIDTVADTIEIARLTGIVHRDIKPGNILIDKHETIKLIDFGLAKDEADDVSDQIFDQGTPLGTPLYMPPEQCMDPSKCDFRSDIYSLGATLYRCLTGEAPYTAKTAIDVMTKIVQDPLPDFKEKIPDAPGSLHSLLKTMLAKSPDNRFQSIAELKKALHNILNQ